MRLLLHVAKLQTLKQSQAAKACDLPAEEAPQR
jgi:hypothetical protein